VWNLSDEEIDDVAKELGVSDLNDAKKRSDSRVTDLEKDYVQVTWILWLFEICHRGVRLLGRQRISWRIPTK